MSLYLQSLDITSTSPYNATADTVPRYLAFLRARGRRPGTVESHQTAIRRFHAWLLEQGHASHNPAAKRVRIATGRRVPRAVSQDHLAALIDSIAGDDPLAIRDRAIIELLYSTGLRAAELLSMRLSSHDLRAHTVRLIGKGNVEAIVPFGNRSATALADYLERARHTLAPRESHDATWVNCFGGPLVYAGLRRILRERSLAAGLPVVRPHMIRHSFATHLMERGANLREIQELMRHANIRTTQIYLHLDTARLAQIRAKFHPRD